MRRHPCQKIAIQALQRIGKRKEQLLPIEEIFDTAPEQMLARPENMEVTATSLETSEIKEELCVTSIATFATEAVRELPRFW